VCCPRSPHKNAQATVTAVGNGRCFAGAHARFRFFFATCLNPSLAAAGAGASAAVAAAAAAAAAEGGAGAAWPLEVGPLWQEAKAAEGQQCVTLNTDAGPTCSWLGVQTLKCEMCRCPSRKGASRCPAATLTLVQPWGDPQVEPWARQQQRRGAGWGPGLCRSWASLLWQTKAGQLKQQTDNQGGCAVEEN
jgi:hypothetical protein